MRRTIGIIAGIAIHAVFGIMVWYLYWFLKGGKIGTDVSGLWLDAGLALQFVVVHSLLLYPAVRERLTEWITAPFYGLFFCVATTFGLALAMAFWQPSSAE